jgi:3-phenylpropionate/cinnamic acid dioxygenase small subunit
MSNTEHGISNHELKDELKTTFYFVIRYSVFRVRYSFLRQTVFVMSPIDLKSLLHSAHAMPQPGYWF